MNRKVATLLLSLVMMFGLIVLIVEMAPVVKSSDIIYVDDVPGVGPKNPPEDYTSIQAAVDAAEAGDTVYVYSGKYLENVKVNKTINLTGENRANTTVDGGGSSIDVVSITADWVNVSGFMVMNGNDGIKLHAAQNCRIFNNTVYSNNIRGIFLGDSKGNNITGNTALNNDKGITLSHSSGNNITGNTAYSNSEIGIFITDSSDNWIMGNNVSNNDMGISIQNDAENNKLINNNVSSCNIGIWFWDSCGNTLADNTMVNNGIWIDGWSVEYWNTHHIDTSNTINGKLVQYWKNQNGGEVPAGAGQVILANCTNVRVEGQEPTHGTVGIALGYSSNNYILGNNVSSNIYSGIYLVCSNGNTITNNNASSNNTQNMGAGIWLRVSNGNNIIGNKASFISAGIYSDYSSGNNMIENTFSNNGYGFSFQYNSNNNTIVNNIVSSNMIGIWLVEETLNNLIYHNIFINNPAFDETDNGNRWDYGYPEGGNYWSDFDEPGEGAYDDFNGSDQNILGSDGIVDLGLPSGGKNPYVIDPDSQDNYPLINFCLGLYLYPGWNLISIPHIQIDRDLGSVLKSIKDCYDTVWWYNASDKKDNWKVNNTSKPPLLNDMDIIDHKMGFWIHITEPYGVLFNYPGIRLIENQTITFHPGWNLVGYPSLDNRIRAKALNNLTFGGDVDSIWTYDAAIQRWDEIGTSDYFELGRGYWIHSKVENVWDVPL